jgi:hypothetical protein
MRKPSFTSKTRRTLELVAACATAGLVALSSAVSLAAYIDLTVFNNSVNYKTESIGSTYFGGGSGTSADPYLLSTPDHLRNLQKLNSLGLFNALTNFNLSADITWSGDPLLPIGSDDMPFDGVFDGKGHRITSLVVNGYQTWDVGMFGYVAITGTLKNFILDKPTVYVGANTSGGSADTTNPLASKLANAAKNLAVPSDSSTGSGYINWTNGASSATITGFDTTVTDTAGAAHTITWESSDASLLSYDNNVWTTHATASSSNPTTDLYPVMLTARVYGETDGKVSAYTLERYQVNVLGNGTITAARATLSGSDVTIETGIYKTIWPLDGTGGTTQYHSIYAGFFCGHLDGYAVFLGLVGGNSYGSSTNAKIVVSGRTALSNSSLIGRSRGDDVRDGTGSSKYGHTFDFGKDVTTYSYNACAKPYNGTYYYRYSSSGTAAGNMAKQITYSSALTKKYLKLPTGYTDEDTYKYMRIYPTASKNTSVSYTYTDADGSHSVTGETAMHFSEPLSAAVDTGLRTFRYNMSAIGDRNGDGHVDEDDIIKSDDYNNKIDFDSSYSYVTSRLDSSTYKVNFNLPLGYCVNNGFWVYTKGDNQDIINTVTGKNAFKLTFTITYVATTSSTNKRLNSWQVLYNANNQDIHSYQPLYSNSRYYYGLYYKDAAMQNCLWYDLNHPHTYNATDKRYEEIASKYTPVTIVADGTLQTATATINVDRDDASFWSAYFADYFSSDTWYPCFALGMGRTDSGTTNYLHHAEATGYSAATTITEGADGNWADHYSVWDGPFVTPQAGNNIYSQRGLFDIGDAANAEAQFYNSWFTLNGTMDMNVLSFSSIFTNANGNVASTMNNVDYLYDDSSTGLVFDNTTGSDTYDTYTTWNKASDTKIGFDVTTALATGNATYYYYRNSADPYTVHCDYTNAAYLPTNADGYSAATFTEQSA